MVTQKVSMWGNSLGIRLPQAIALQMGLKEGALVSISTDGDKIILSPARSKYTLDELLKDVSSDMQHNEVNWGEPVGEEDW
ncbi:AbrB/MazE/SpoVT family DNA-binding domain-containing protein [Calothrix rhizosoleniae]|uniref:AbrB/MazE/SpoVT family DNA-binding domain-containing protein n=1 Tax=Calothrix rhizosoleniae TaxID=888997 RepID=UPI000B4A3507|nr:AbrB/MazE/SpoVT family DNA-binding domain-containing protein [Calothrix rhizosoleniae]